MKVGWNTEYENQGINQLAGGIELGHSTEEHLIIQCVIQVIAIHVATTLSVVAEEEWPNQDC